MKEIRYLNGYAGAGGNRELLPDYVKVVAVEIIQERADIYKKRFPQDKVIIGDVHNYLYENYEYFDFIWLSPPCPTHSRIRNIAGVGRGQNKPVYADMKLWQEIIFLNQVYHSKGTKFKGRFCVENVPTYYRPLIRPQIIGRHYFWTNFYVLPFKQETRGHMLSNQDLMKIKGIKINDKTILRNCTEPELGLHIFNCAYKEKQEVLV